MTEIKEGQLIVHQPLALGAPTAVTSEVQSLTLASLPGTFKLSFTAPASLGGATGITGLLNTASPTFAADLTTALNAAGVLPAGGTAAVVQTGGVFYVTFGGTLANQALNLLAVVNLITSESLTGNMATLTTPTGNNLFVGDTVVVAGLTTNAFFNGPYVVTATTATSFSYALTHADVAGTADSGTPGSSSTMVCAPRGSSAKRIWRKPSGARAARTASRASGGGAHPGSPHLRAF